MMSAIDKIKLRDWTHISCISRWILYHWATMETRVKKQQLEPDMEQRAGSKSGKE